MNDFAKFLSVNRLKRKDIASFLGVSSSFVSQIVSGDRPLPEDKLALIKANAKTWDISMLVEQHIFTPKNQLTDNALVEYLERKVENQDMLIRDLYQQIGMLEAKLKLYYKGGSLVEGADPSSSASAV